MSAIRAKTAAPAPGILGNPASIGAIGMAGTAPPAMEGGPALSASGSKWMVMLDALPGLAQRFLASAFRLVAGSPRKLLISLVMAVSVLAVAWGGIGLLSRESYPLPRGLLLPDETGAQELLMAMVNPDAEDGDDGPAPGKLPPLPVTLKVRNYVVRSGDSLASVAKRFGLRQDTIISLNRLGKASSFKAGMSLRIPNMDGLSHTVARGESLGSLSKKYGIDMTKLADANDLSSSVIARGQDLFIPGVKLPESTLRGFYGQKVVWPVRGPISSPYGPRSDPFTGARTFHSAIDIVVARGTPIKAAMDGKVADAGYNSVFGNYVIMKHAEGFQTLYGHLDRVDVRVGQSLDQGTTIGRSGNTGYSTGPHLHFSLFRSGQAIDPRKYLK